MFPKFWAELSNDYEKPFEDMMLLFMLLIIYIYIVFIHFITIK
jgi:hypothetical protein